MVVSTRALWIVVPGWWLTLGLYACVSDSFTDGQFLCDPQAPEPCPPGLVCVDGLCRRPPVAGEGGGGGSGGSGGGGQGGTAGGGGAGGAVGGGGAGGTVLPTPPSCIGLAADCGHQQATDCCAGAKVDGGLFHRSNDPTYPAQVGDFWLDKFEVTVGRYRAFVAAGRGTAQNPPAPGDGAHPAIAQSGWDAAWNSLLPADTAALEDALDCYDGHTYTPTAGSGETRPINCVNWTMAFAFCAWDEGRLPTEAEWNYAAAGGDDQNLYPWGPDFQAGYAFYDCLADGNTGCALSDILPVGSLPDGDARWGHSDLAGNLWERVLDTYGTYPLPCVDCANVQSGGQKVYRGGGYRSPEVARLQTSTRDSQLPGERVVDVGFRCARALP